MSTRVYRLPDFFALLPSKPGGEICPHFREVKTAFNSWVKEKFGGTQMETEFQRTDGVLLPALTYPMASLQQLKWLVDYMTVFFLTEALTDSTSSTVAEASVQSWIKMLTESYTPEEEESFHPYLKIMLRDLVPSVKAVAGPFHWPRFMEENKAYVVSIMQEALDREASTRNHGIRDVKSYATMRRESVGGRPCFTLIQSTRQLFIPDDVLDHPAIREMENAASDMLWIVNDVYSFKKELVRDGALNNLLTVLQRVPETSGLDLQERLDYAEKLFREAVEQFHTSRNKLPWLKQEMEQQVAVYADGLVDWAVGNLQFHAVSRRYDVFMNEEDRKNRVLRMELSPLARL